MANFVKIGYAYINLDQVKAISDRITEQDVGSEKETKNTHVISFASGDYMLVPDELWTGSVENALNSQTINFVESTIESIMKKEI